MKIRSKIWQKWKVFAERVGNFQARIILTVFYFIIFAIPGIIALFLDVLHLKKEGESNWHLREKESLTLKDVKRQW